MGESSNIFHWVIGKVGLKQYANEWILSILGSIFVILVLAVMAFLFWYKLRRTKDKIVPSGKFTLTNVVEIAVESLLNMMRGVMGDRAEKFLPLIGTLFIYIFCCNIIGFIPGFISPTTTITTNLACALVVFVFYNVMGIKELGLWGYLRHFLGPVVWLAPLFFSIELISHFVRPVSLSVRLFGNMVGDHLVYGMFSYLVPLVVPIFFIALGLFVSFIQAFVFSILSSVYIALATEHR